MNNEVLPTSLRAAQQNRILALHAFAGDLLVQQLEARDTIARLLEETRRILDAEAVAVGLLRRSETLLVKYAAGRDVDFWVGSRWSTTDSVLDKTVRDARPQLINGGRQGEQSPFGPAHPIAALAPIVQQQAVAGLVWAVRSGSDRFFSADLELLGQAATILSWALVLDEAAERSGNARARLEHLFADGFDPVIVTDAARTIVEVNQQAQAFFAPSGEELVGRPLDGLHAAGDSLPEPASLSTEETVSFRGRVALPTGSRNRSDGSGRPVEVRVRRLLTTPDETWQWIYHDMTNQEELEQVRQDVTTMLVHDLQSPLGNVMSSLELIKHSLAGVDVSEDTLELLDVASRSSGQLLRLIQSLLDMSRLEAGQPLRNRKPVRLVDIIDDAYEIAMPDFERRQVTLARKLPAALPKINIDANLINRVLLNLFDNALKHSSAGDTITIGARREGDLLLISVSDQGIGIPEGQREAVFDKYHRIKTEPASKGLGLGLAFCRLAVEAHGGNIRAAEAAGGGARLEFTLPTTAAATPEAD